MAGDATRVQADFTAVWNTALTHYASQLETFCPPWSLVRDELLQPKNIAVANALMDNKHYPSIGPLAAQLGKQIKVVKDLQSDKLGAVIQEGLLKRCRLAVDSGVETLAFTFACFNLLREWPEKVLNVPMAKKAVKEFRKDLQATGVVLSSEINEAVDGWESGFLLPDAVAARQKAEAAKAAKASPAAPQPPASANAAQWEQDLIEDLGEVRNQCCRFGLAQNFPIPRGGLSKPKPATLILPGSFLLASISLSCSPQPKGRGQKGEARER